jgi:L-gulonate 3-dehydrogenase
LPARVRTMLTDMKAAGLAEDVEGPLSRIGVFDTLAEAVAPADYIQESVHERVELKTAIANAIGQAMRPDAIVGSSASGIVASLFTAEAAHRERFLVAHPVNPPHLVPICELVPAPWTDPAVVTSVRALMADVGQVPVTVNREIEGFILNRLQGALLAEAWTLLAEGYASAADIDATITAGLGLRWSFIGPFETMDLNATGGIDDYARRFSGLYQRMAASRGTEPSAWSPEAVERARQERRAAVPAEALAARRDWRDRRLMALRAHQREQEE